MAKVIFEYDETSGIITDSKGQTTVMYNMVPFKHQEPDPSRSDVTFKFVQQGLSVDEIIKLKNQGLLE